MTNQLALVNEKNVRQVPKSVNIKVGNFYDMTDGKTVEIVSIRTNGDEVHVYYKYFNSYGKWYKRNYTRASLPLDSFKAQLLDLGSIQELFVEPLSN